MSRSVYWVQKPEQARGRFDGDGCFARRSEAVAQRPVARGRAARSRRLLKRRADLGQRARPHRFEPLVWLSLYRQVNCESERAVSVDTALMAVAPGRQRERGFRWLLFPRPCRTDADGASTVPLPQWTHGQCAAAAEPHRLGDRFRLSVSEDLERGGVTGVIVEREHGSGGLGELLAELALELLAQRAGVERGLRERGG